MRNFNLKFKSGYETLSQYKQDYKWGDIVGDFKCPKHSDISSLEGSPRIVRGQFSIIDGYNLTSLKGGPLEAQKFECSENRHLISLEGAPQIVHEYFDASFCKITSLEGIGRKYLKDCKELDVGGNPITSNILGVILIKNLEDFYCDSQIFKSNKRFKKIFVDFNRNGHQVLECQEWLIENGFKELAKL